MIICLITIATVVIAGRGHIILQNDTNLSTENAIELAMSNKTRNIMSYSLEMRSSLYDKDLHLEIINGFGIHISDE